MSQLGRTTAATTAVSAPSTAAAASDADAMCRGIGTAPDLAGAAPSRNLADTPAAPTAAREAVSCEGWFDPADTLMAPVVRWAITAYYDQPELGHAPRGY